MRDKVEPKLKAFLEEMDRNNSGSGVLDLTLDDARNNDISFLNDLWSEEIISENIEINDMYSNLEGLKVPLRMYRSGNTESVLPVIIYFHGGGWVLGNIETRNASCADLAEKSGACVVSVEYRLAPEHPFPAAVNDCYSAVSWLYKNAEKLKLDKKNFIVMGDSAGGNLAAVTANKAAEKGYPELYSQVLLYPVINLASIDTPSYHEFAENHFVTRELMNWFIKQYVPEINMRSNPEVSPIMEKFRNPPPKAYVVTAECDVLRDEGEQYAERLKDNGVETYLQRFNGMIHGFFDMPNISPAAQEARNSIINKIKESFIGK